ncbi:hypothetical protein KIW84_021818 [Lathyrus oleraceus]|uniref:Uncharacterized protein n=1 Tax=Pisum sativum TaxID=3888 RepID=A0A9D4YA39_PEA|nr:hypothetical protein KIW84_021818 [Pisum sativum]
MMDQPNQTIPTKYVMNEVGSAATTEVVIPKLVNTQPTKKRKASESGSRQSSACWEHFIRLPDDLLDTPTATFIPNHKGDTVGRKIEEVLRDWGIRNVSTITVDNATSNDVAVAYLHRKISTTNGMMGDGKCFHMRRAAHILNFVNATYLMLEAAEKFQAAFDKLEYEESSYREFFGKGSPPSSDDWDIVRAFISFLKLSMKQLMFFPPLKV